MNFYNQNLINCSQNKMPKNFINNNHLYNEIINSTIKGSKLTFGCKIINSTINNCLILDNCEIIDSCLDNCIIHSGTKINKSTIYNEVIIHSYCNINESQIYNQVSIGQECKIGPFSHIHDYSSIENNCRIGNFVEIKKSQINDGTKIAHLSYIGDSFINKNVNIGAGVIICNYDGKEKHQTHIGSNTFVGSNTLIIAPRKIGDNCKIGAGSIVDFDIENNMFYLRRSNNIKYTKNKEIHN